MTSTVLTGGRVVTPAGVLSGGWVQVAEGVIVAVAEGGARPHGGSVVDLEDAWLVPGYVELHVHGGGGHDVMASREAMAGAVAFHAAHGVTATLVSLVTAPVDELRRVLGDVAALVPGGHVLGAHLEGPFLSPARAGAQNPDHMRAPDRELLHVLLAAGPVATMTIAPELPGALALIDELRRANVCAALGHSDATFDQATAAVAAGASHVTHLFNGMAPLHQREPGLAGAALAAGLTAEIILDGHHLHPSMAGLVRRPVLVTDAIDAAGAGDGPRSLGGRPIEVRDGVARTLDTGSLAGSTLTFDAAVRHAVGTCGLAVVEAVRAASTTPAEVLGLAGRIGSIAPGRRADLLVLDDDLHVTRIMRSGSWDAASPPAPTD